MIVTLLLTLEGSDPEVSRCVNVDDSMDLSQLAQVIDAAFGFSGAASHLYVTGDGKFRQVFSEMPGPDEAQESEVMVHKITEITYIYDPTANWNIRVQVLGETQLDGPTPLLVDAAGPDIIEAANGPEMMTQFRNEARRIAAGLAPNMEVTPLLLSFLPVMSPERILQRLTVADPVTVATRISFVAEEIFFDQGAGHPGMPGPNDLAHRFDEFLDSRPELRDILQDDPQPDRNPTLLAAVAEFFEDNVPTAEEPPFGVPEFDEPEPEPVPDNVIPLHRRTPPADAPLPDYAPDWVRDQPPAAPFMPAGTFSEDDYFPDILLDLFNIFAKPVKLTKKGQLPSKTVRDIAGVFGIQSFYQQPRETTYPTVQWLRQVLEGAGFIEEEGNCLSTSALGNQFIECDGHTGIFIDAWAAGFEHAFGTALWKEHLWTLAHLFNLGEHYGINPPAPTHVPNRLEDTVLLLGDMGALMPDAATGRPDMTPSATKLFSRMLSYYVHGM